MPTIEDIQAAIERNDADAAESLLAEVMAKGLSGGNQQKFEHEIAQIRAHTLPVQPEPVKAPEPVKVSARGVSTTRRVKVGKEGLEDA